MAGNPIGWFEIYVQDMARACKFYGAVLGIQGRSPEGQRFGHSLLALSAPPRRYGRAYDYTNDLTTLAWKPLIEPDSLSPSTPDLEPGHATALCSCGPHIVIVLNEIPTST